MTTYTTTHTMDYLVNALHSHLLGRALPEPAVVSFSAHGRELISVQPDGGRDDLRHLGDLLLWAYTLAEVTARWWRTTDDRLHVTVTGRTVKGVRLKVYGSIPFRACDGLVPLTVDESEGVSLDEVYALVGLLREQRKGVA